MEIGDGAGSASGDDRFAARGGQAADNGRHAAAYVLDVLDARRASGDDLAVSLIELLDLVEHARRENPGMRDSALLPRGGPSPGRRVVEMLLRGIYSLGRGNPAGGAKRRRA